MNTVHDDSATTWRDLADNSHPDNSPNSNIANAK